MRPNRTVARRVLKRPLPWFLAGCALFLYLILFTPSGATIFLSGDVYTYLLNAQRMLHGQVMYKDFFQFTTPGTELVYLTLFKLFGVRLWISNFMLLALGLSLVWFSVVISQSIMSGPAVYLPGLCFLTCCLFSERDPTHHWYSILAVIGAVTLLLPRRTPGRVAAAAIPCGLATFFTQLRGVTAVAGFLAFLVWDHRREGERTSALRRKCSLLIVTFLAFVVAAHAYFAWKAGVKLFLDSTVMFGLRYYPAHSYENTWRAYLFSPPALRPWYGWPWLLAYYLVHLLIPGVYLVFLVRYLRSAAAHPEYPWDRLMLVCLTGLFQFLGIAPAPSFFRLGLVSLPGWILLAWLLTVPGKVEHALACLAWAFVGLLLFLEPIKVQRRAEVCLQLPAGTAAFRQGGFYEYELFKWLSEHTHPSDWFFQADWADTYVPLELQNPTPVPYVTNTDYTRPEQVQQVIRALDIRQVQLVVWGGAYMDIPRQVPPSHDHLGPLRAYLRDHYRLVKIFPDGEEVWQRCSRF
jgi:hypothetical protein